MRLRRPRHRRRVVVTIAGGLAGVTLGVLVTPALQHRPPSPPAVVGLAPASSPPSTEERSPLPEPATGTLLVWTPDHLPDGLAAATSQMPGVRAATVVRGGPLGLTGSWDGTGAPIDQPASGFRIPLDAMVFEPATYPAFLPPSVRPAFAGLVPGQAILGATSAGLRHLRPGAVMQLVDGRRVTVTAVVDDAYVGATEIALTGATTLAARYLLVSYDGDRTTLERNVRSALPAGIPVRFRAPGETPFLRQGDAVVAQVFIKQRFGEFAYRIGAGRQIVEDPAWEAANIVNVTVPVLGQVRCHRALVPQLRAALQELQRRNLTSLIDVRGFQGCWNPVLIEPGGDVSRHAWGAALDINYGRNPTGVDSGQDPRLVDIMERSGFTWGGPWLVPDPAHFEALIP